MLSTCYVASCIVSTLTIYVVIVINHDLVITMEEIESFMLEWKTSFMDV